MTPGKLVATGTDDDSFRFSLDDLSVVPDAALALAIRTGHHVIADLELEQTRRSQVLPAAPPSEQAIRIEKVCERTGFSYDYLIRHWRKMGGIKGADGRVRFSLDAVQRMAQGRG